MRNLDPNHRVVYAYEKAQKIARVSLMHNGALKAKTIFKKLELPIKAR